MTKPPISLIIDTDPGVDDMLALLLALSSSTVDLKLISLCFGNCDTENSLRNALSLFHVLKMEESHRGNGFKYTKQKPKLAVGMKHAIDGSMKDATEVHGRDGLGNVHNLRPEFTCSPEWLELFQEESSEEYSEDLAFVPIKRPSYEEILEILRTEPADSVVICAIGPLMNLAKAAELDYATFSRVKQICFMGGALNIPGNVTPVAEFNVFADALAASRVFNCTSYENEKKSNKSLDIVLFPLDITHQHVLNQEDFGKIIDSHKHVDGPLVAWLRTWMTSTFQARKNLNMDGPGCIELHDPLTTWYVLTREVPGWKISKNLDLRIETHGEWSKGCIVHDKRGRTKYDSPQASDRGNWLLKNHGNRINVAVESPNGKGGEKFGLELIEQILS